MGISLFDSTNYTISKNIFFNNGIVISSFTLSHFVYSIENNTVNGKPLLFYINKDNKILNGIEVGQLILFNCTNFEIKNIKISNTDMGIELLFSNNNKISNCNISNNDNEGIKLFNSNNNTISNCNILNNEEYGILLSNSEFVIISNCNISKNNDIGINLYNSPKSLSEKYDIFTEISVLILKRGIFAT